LNNIFFIKPIENIIKNDTSFLVYEIQFEPNKPFKTHIDFLLIRPNGGQWKYKILLNAIEPEDTDVINIYSCLNKVTTVSFKLGNR